MGYVQPQETASAKASMAPPGGSDCRDAGSGWREEGGFSSENERQAISHLDRVSVGGRWGSLCGQEQIETEGGMP